MKLKLNHTYIINNRKQVKMLSHNGMNHLLGNRGLYYGDDDRPYIINEGKDLYLELHVVADITTKLHRFLYD